MDILSYHVATNVSPTDLSEEINALVKRGYRPWGQMVIRGDELVQPMVIPAEKEPKPPWEPKYQYRTKRPSKEEDDSRFEEDRPRTTKFSRVSV